MKSFHKKMTSFRRKMGSRRGPDNSGFVLVTVLWVVAIMTVITLGFGRRAILERTAATYALNHTQAMHMARGAVARGIAELRNKAVYDFLSQTEGRTSYSQQWSRPKDLLKGEESYFLETGNEEFAEDQCAYAIQDEESRVSIGAAADELLDEVPNLSRSIIRKIDVRRKGNSAENIQAQAFQTVEEIRFFEGVSEEDWFGSKGKPGLRDLLTCWGDGKINVNTASAEVLACVPGASGAARSIADFRAGGDRQLFTEDDQDFISLEDLGNKLGVSGKVMESLQKYCKVTSQYFTITGTATRRRGKIRATCTATVAIVADKAQLIKWREEFLEP